MGRKTSTLCSIFVSLFAFPNPLFVIRYSFTFMVPLAFLRCFDFLYAIPLIFATSFVYAASRNENTQNLVYYALRMSASLGFFMVLTLIIMAFLF